MKRILFLSGILLFLSTLSFAEAPRIILDTDVCGDYDDIGALATLFNLESEGKCRVLGVASSNSHADAVPLVEAIARSFGRGDVPIARPVAGAREAVNWMPVKFSKVVTRRFSHPRFAATADAPEAVAVYKKLLAAQPDRSATLCVVGWASNLAALLEAADGRELVRRKVVKLVWMAGRAKGGGECNFATDTQASKRVLADFPRPIVLSMFEIGEKVFTGTRLVKALGPDDPVRLCYSTVFDQDAAAAKRGRASWDQTAVWYAVHGDDGLFKIVRGTCAAVGDDGTNSWKDDADGLHARLEFVAPPETVAAHIEDCMISRPPVSRSSLLTPRSSLFTSSDSRPFVWWHWCGTAVTKEGIVRDLDAMLEAGIGGATIFQVARGPCSETIAEGYEDETNPQLEFGSDAWCDLVAFAAHETKIRGLEIGMHNCPGYTVSGGPWITPANAMKKLVWTSAPTGTVPPQPETNLGFYREIGTVTNGTKVFRFGYTCTGSQCMPVAKSLWGRCLEADKMSATAVNLHLDRVLRRPLGLDFILMDSYEAGSYDWTDDFREEFSRRRGYDPLPLLSAYVGATVENAEKIKADMARTVEELSTERHYWVFRDRLHAAGLKFVVEPYGGPFDTCEAAYASDMPTTEFWGKRPFWETAGVIGGYPRMGGAAGRAAGRTILAAEAFTAMPFDDPYTVSPRDLKACADATFARGINRMLLHHWVHQPFPACRKPGMGMGYWGTHFGENQTWFEPGKAFFRYLRNCQEELQRGEEIVDVLSVEVDPERGDNMDAIPRRVFLNGTELVDGQIRLRDSGRAYRYLRVPTELLKIPKIAAKAKACERAGVVMTQRGQAPRRPFEIVSGVAATPEGPVLGTARQLPDGTRLFFVANVSTNVVPCVADFRAEGEVEAWNPETGRAASVMEVARCADRSHTRLSMTLDPLESRFLRFGGDGERHEGQERRERKKSLAPHVPLVPHVKKLSGPWRLSFGPNRGAPSSPLALTNLVSWTEFSDFGIRFFSGTATYRTTFVSEKQNPNAVLDLGDVRDIAHVRLNGCDLGVVWHFPFRVACGEELKAGENILEIEVTNGWHNRLLGDRRLPDDCLWGPLRFHQCAMDGAKGVCGRGLKRIPDWAWEKDGRRPSTNRVTFTSWDYFSEGGELVPSGLMGPVRIVL